MAFHASRPGLLLLASLAAAGCGGGATARDAGNGPFDAPIFDVPPLADGNVAGYALSFDGINDYATAGNAGFPAASAPQTISLWVNYLATTATQDFIVLRLDFDSGVQIGIRGGTITVWRTYSGRTLVAAPTTPATGQWHHVAYTFDRTTHVLYVDGVMVASSTATGDERTPNTVWLGTVDGSAELYSGLMDEVRVWSIVRAPADIQKDMFHRMEGPEAGLVAYWTFDDSQNGGRCADMSKDPNDANRNDVTLGDGIAERMPSRVLSDAPVVPGGTPGG
jgi:hypothetical protein